MATDRSNFNNKTGNAPIIRQGHTASNKYGSDPNFKGKTGSTTPPRDLNVK